MNLLFGAARDFAEQLKPYARGWVVTPLVCFEQCRLAHGNIFHYRSPPNHISPWDFLYQNPVGGGTVNLAVRVPKCPLRIIGLNYYEMEDTVYLSYYRANGFAIRDDCPRRAMFERVFNKAGIEIPDGYEQMKVYRIWRVSKVHKTLKFEADYYHLSETPIPQTVLANAAGVIARSFQWIGRGKNEKFNRGQHHIGIDLDGRAHTLCSRTLPSR